MLTCILLLFKVLKSVQKSMKPLKTSTLSWSHSERLNKRIYYCAVKELNKQTIILAAGAFHALSYGASQTKGSCKQAGRTQVCWLMAGQNPIMNGNAEIEDHLNCGEYAEASTDSGLVADCNHYKNIFRRAQSHLYYFSTIETLLNY